MITLTKTEIRSDSTIKMENVIAIGHTYKQILEQLLDGLNDENANIQYDLKLDDDIDENPSPAVEEVEAEDLGVWEEVNPPQIQGGTDEKQ